MKLRLLVCALMCVGTWANAETATNGNPPDQSTAASSLELAEAVREKTLNDEFSKCVLNNPKYKNRCAMLEASKASILHSQSIVAYATSLQMSNVYIKYLTDRESSGLGYCRLKGAAQAAKAKYDPIKNVSEILELIAGCMALQYQQVGKQENELNQIIEK